MKAHSPSVAVIGRGLIGGSLEQSALRAGLCAAIFPGRGPAPDLSSFDFVFVAVPPEAVATVVAAIAADSRLRPGTVVMDIAGVKRPVAAAVESIVRGRDWFFIPAHPMAGKEKTGYANADARLFDGASMILTPYPETPPATLEAAGGLLRKLGFARVVVTDPAHHDEMIAFTSQLCHLISSAYVREPLAESHAGYSAGSFRDMVRVGAPDPEVWTQLFAANRDRLLPVVDRFIARMAEFREALAADDRARLRSVLEAGVAAKSRIDEGSKPV